MPTNGQNHSRRRQALVSRIARAQGGLVTARQLYELDLTPDEIEAEVRARRWRRVGAFAIQVDDPDGTTPWWRGLFEVGPAAALDGVTALLAAGLKTITHDVIQISVPKSAEARTCDGVRVYETRRYRAEDVIRVGVPRMHPAVAAVRAAIWARSDEQASLFVIAPVQQRIVRVDDLAAAIGVLKRTKRRPLLNDLLADLRAGVQALGERDFARACRRRGIPEPDRQEMRRLPSGRVYYDATWFRYGVKAEIHGAQHLDVVAATRDALKANAASVAGARVVIIPNHAFRTNPKPFLDQLEAALRAGGWGSLNRVASA